MNLEQLKNHTKENIVPKLFCHKDNFLDLAFEMSITTDDLGLFLEIGLTHLPYADDIAEYEKDLDILSELQPLAINNGHDFDWNNKHDTEYLSIFYIGGKLPV